ncbi:MAG TPA: ABC transporter substrate-binding protein, partial [Vicinamibacteria bacterium]|nr:ABC transporter substrate-binding protein [Vicinamibacteria bacterium]
VLAALLASRVLSLRSERPLRIASTGELLSLDPLVLEGTTVLILSNVFEGLVRHDRDMRIEPALAVHWATLDDTTWQFDLRPGVRFHDGTPLTAGEIKGVFDRVRSDPTAPGQQLIANIASVQVSGPLSLKVVTRMPSPTLLSELGWFRIARGASAADVATKAVGTGPYRVARWEKGKRVELDAFEDYWGSLPSARRLEIQPIPPGERLAALERGAIDIASLPAAVAGTRLTRLTRLQIIRADSLTRMFLWMHELADAAGPNPLADRRVRQAVALALDRSALRADPDANRREASFELVPRALFGYSPQLEEPHQDLASARRLLAAAGYRDGFEAPLIHAPDPLAAKTAAAVSQMLAAVGIKTEPRPADKGQVMAALGGALRGFLVERWTYDDADAGAFLRDCVHSRDAAEGTGQFNPGFSDPAADRMIDASLTTMDVNARLARYQEIMRWASVEQPVIPLFDQMYVYGVGPNVTWHPRLDGYILGADVATP